MFPLCMYICFCSMFVPGLLVCSFTFNCSPENVSQSCPWSPESGKCVFLVPVRVCELGLAFRFYRPASTRSLSTVSSMVGYGCYFHTFLLCTQNKHLRPPNPTSQRSMICNQQWSRVCLLGNPAAIEIDSESRRNLGHLKAPHELLHLLSSNSMFSLRNPSHNIVPNT